MKLLQSPGATEFDFCEQIFRCKYSPKPNFKQSCSVSARRVLLKPLFFYSKKFSLKKMINTCSLGNKKKKKETTKTKTEQNTHIHSFH